MTKTTTYTCYISVTQTKDLEKEQEENTVMVELFCDDPPGQKVLDTNKRVAVSATGQVLSLAVASVLMEASLISGIDIKDVLTEFMGHVKEHVNKDSERMDPDILKFDINWKLCK